MMKQKQFSLDFSHLTSLFLCDILGNEIIVPSHHRREWCGTFHLAEIAKPPFKFFLQSYPFLCGFVRMVKRSNTLLCKSNILCEGSNPSTYFWLIGITLVNTKWWLFPP